MSSNEHIKYAQAIQSGLTIRNPKLRQRINLQFKDLTDEETICWIMCEICGWSYRRVACALRISHKTIKERVEAAITKKRQKKMKAQPV